MFTENSGEGNWLIFFYGAGKVLLVKFKHIIKPAFANTKGMHKTSAEVPRNWETLKTEETSLLRRLQTQTLPDATPPLGKIPPFSKIAVTFEPVKQFRCPSRFQISKKIKIVYFMTESTTFNH